MAGAVQTMDLSEFANFANALATNLSRAEHHMEDPFKACAVAMRASTMENFEGSHEPDGTPWPALAHPRGNSKGTDKPLQDTGILYSSITASDQGHIEEISNEEMKWGTNLEYAGVHQYGYTFPERSRDKPWVFDVNGHTVFTRHLREIIIPPRRFLGFNEKLTKLVMNIFGEFLISLSGLNK